MAKGSEADAGFLSRVFIALVVLTVIAGAMTIGLAFFMSEEQIAVAYAAAE